MTRILVVGAGAVGAYYAALIARRYPNDVILLARKESFRAITQGGIILREETKKNGKDEQVMVQVTDDPSSLTRADYVIETVKMYDLEFSLSQLRDVLEASKGIFGLQNGIEKEEMIEKYGGRNLLLATTYVSSEKLAPGMIGYMTETPRVYLGERNDGRSARVLEIQKLLNDSGIECVVPENILLEVWSKFVYACSILGVCAAARCDLATAIAYEPTHKLLSAALEEGFLVAAAQGVEIPERRKAKYRESFTRLDPSRPSMLVDALRGRKTEVDYINGALLRKASEKGMTAPVNEFLYGVISAPKLSA